MHYSILQCNHDVRVVTCNILHVADGGIDLPSALEPKHWQSQNMIPGMDKEPPQNHSIPEPSGFQYVSKHIAEVQDSLDLAALPASALLRRAEAQCRVLRQFVHRLLQGTLRKGFGRERHRISSESGLNTWLRSCLSIEVSWHSLRAALHNRHDTCLYLDTFTIDIGAAQVLRAALCRGERSSKGSWKSGHKSHSIMH